MRPLTINYQKVFPLAQYVNEKIGIEMEVEPGDSVEDVLSAAKKCVEEWHKASYPHLYQQPSFPLAADTYKSPTNYSPEPIAPTAIPEIKITPQDKTIGLFTDDILSCQDIKTLETYKMLVKGKEYLQKAYDQRLKELQ